MEIVEFIKLIENLTGSSVKFSPIEKNEKIEKKLLQEAILDDYECLNYSQFNELLLLCNKDRITNDFFNYFFIERTKLDGNITLRKLEKGIECFRKLAMLVFGNFKFAYRELSKMNRQQIEEKLKKYIKDPFQIEENLRTRPNKITEIDVIPKEKTYLTGYLSGKHINIDHGNCIWLLNNIPESSDQDTWEEFKKKISKELEKLSSDRKDFKIGIEELIKKYEEHGDFDVTSFKFFISKSFEYIDILKRELNTILPKAIKNDQIYLTDDYIDIYLATSMRKFWEFEEVCDFVDGVLESDDLKNLNLRYYNPIQAYEESNIDKGIVEGLMLKRAKCTMYLMQESDTFGKDSELAATLAQGKPVIVYLMEIDDVEKRAEKICDMPLAFFVDRYKLLYDIFEDNNVISECSEKLGSGFSDSPKMFANSFIRLIEEHLNKRIWNSIETPWASDSEFKNSENQKFTYFCKLIAIAEKYFYNKRANTLKDNHPLRLQVNLSTGVANGVLVVRNYSHCKRLIKKIVTNELYYDLDSFNIEYSNDNGGWILEEVLSKSVHRVVTDNVKITNSFWNFYNIKKEV